MLIICLLVVQCQGSDGFRSREHLQKRRTWVWERGECVRERYVLLIALRKGDADYPTSSCTLPSISYLPLIIWLLIYPLQDIGASGTNTASVALDATLVTSVLKHGYDGGTGAVEGYQSGTKGV